MPGLRQPEPLEELAFKFLLFRSVIYCDDLSLGGYLTRLRRSVADIKQNIHSHVPATIFAEFCRKFLEYFHRVGEGRPPIERPASHHRAALEMITDVKIIGLTLEGCMIHYFDPVEAPRIHGLKVLDWSGLHYTPMARGLENFNLQDLTTFVFPINCTDHHLSVIASQCNKLQVLRVQESDVTDNGLRALRSCSHLRVLSIHYCLVSDEGVNEALNVHTKLQEFNVDDYLAYTVEDSFSILSRSISLVCPSVKRFSLRTNPATDAHLTSVVALFPNLTYLNFCCQITGDLCILRDLEYLTKLRFAHSSGNLSLENLKQLLMTIGENISVLTIEQCHPNVCLTQNDVDFIFKFCGNIEHFSFDYKVRQPMDTLVIPPFKKLMKLLCNALINSDDPDSRVGLEFGKMLALDILIIKDFDQIFDMIESIMLDTVRFPKLSAVGMFNNPNERTDRIQETARSNNLDFTLLFEQL